MQLRRWMLTIALALPVLACQPAEPPAAPGSTFTADDEAAIRSLLSGYTTTALAGDWAGNAAYYTADAVRMPPNATMFSGRDAVVAFWESFPKFTGFTLDMQHVGGDGDLAWARGSYMLEFAPAEGVPAGDEGKWQAVYQRQDDGSWLCVSDIWNSNLPAM